MSYRIKYLISLKDFDLKGFEMTNVCVINSEIETYYFIKELGLIIQEIYYY